MSQANLLKIFILSALASTFGCNSRKFEDVPGNNAIWTESLYLRGYRPSNGQELTDDLIEEYANTLRRNKVKYAYLFAGPYGKDGFLPAYPFSTLAQRTVRVLKQHYPEIIILPWVGGIQNKTVYLGDSTWVKNALLDTEKLVRTLGVPGVHIDFEFLLSGDAYLDQTHNEERPGDFDSYGNNVNRFHKKLRKLLPNSFISSVVVATSPDTRPWKRKTSIDELRQLLHHIDQLSFLYYDTRIRDQTLFAKNCRDLIEDIDELQKGNDKVQFLVAIGTFINEPELHKYRDMSIENIPNTLKTIKNAEMEITNNKGKLIDGIAIYCDWETTDEEWEQFSQYWIN